jgi:hypothetical protein
MQIEIRKAHRILWVLFFFTSGAHAQSLTDFRLIPVDSGWSANSVNATSFRKNSLITWKNYQFISYYNARQEVVVGRRSLDSEQWESRVTPFKGNALDAHNSISIMVDGEGYVHLAWDHHNNSLRYAKSTTPASLDFAADVMVGTNENTITYPEFFRLKNGNLLFLYRDGGSGRGNLIMNEYDVRTKSWRRTHELLIDGEGQRSAYWQACVDNLGTVHLSWVWRENPDVASNHDMCYAMSKDNGRTWTKRNGKRYTLPITATTAEYTTLIPQNSDLINQTSMCADEKGNPIIATYWRQKDSTTPQYHIIYARSRKWKVRELRVHTEPFSLSGIGTKSIPISRPQVLATNSGRKASALILFRDEERNNKISAIMLPRISSRRYSVHDLAELSTGRCEPSYDSEAWSERRIISIFVQPVQQPDLEGYAGASSSLVYVLNGTLQK